MTQAIVPSENVFAYSFCARIIVVVLLLGFSMPALAQVPRNAAAELENIRALPYGFHAQCEGKDLKIRKKSTATFVIRNSITCNRLRQLIVKQHRNDFTLCSNDPNHVAVPPDRQTIKCVELQIDDLEI